MTETRHEFVLTASDRTKAAFSSVMGSVNQVRQNVLTATNLMSSALGGVGVVAFTTEMSEMGDLVLQTSDRLGITTEQITALQYAASQFGLDGQAMNGVLQDMSVRIQEFANFGTGEAADFFEGLSLDVREFSDLQPDQLLYRVAQELDGLSDASARVYLDQLGGDSLVELLPALRNNAQGLRELQQEAFDTNRVLSEIDAIRLSNMANEFTNIQNASRTLSMQLAAEFEPAVMAVSQRFNTWASDGDAVSDALDVMAVSGIVVGSVYMGRVVSSLVASTQAKYADMIASRQNAAATLAEAEAGLANTQQKLTTERAAYEASIAEKRREAVASEQAKAAALDSARSAQAAAQQKLAAAKQEMQFALLQSQNKQRAASALAKAKEELTAATTRTNRAEEAYQATVRRNSAAIQSATDSTKKLDRAKRSVEASTKSLTRAQSLYNSTVRAGTIATRGLSAAMGIMGGPIGLMMTAITFGGMWAMSNRETKGTVDLLNASTEELGDTLKESSADELERMLASVRGEIDATSRKMSELKAVEIDDGDIAAQSKRYKRAEMLKIESDKINRLRMIEIQLAAEHEGKVTVIKERQAEIRKSIATQEMLTGLETIRAGALTAEQALKDAYDKEVKILNDALAAKKVSQSEYDALTTKSWDSYQLKLESREQASLQKRMSAFSDNYSERERLAQEHQQRVTQYAIDNNITSENDAAWLAFQKESYSYQLDAFKQYQDGLLQEYRDYDAEKTTLENQRYADEQDRLDEALRKQEIGDEQHKMAMKVAEERHSKNVKDIKKSEWSETLQSHREFADLFVGMQDSKNKQLAAIGKTAALYNIGVRTAEGVMTAWSTSMQLGPILGPIVGGTLSAALIGYGVEQAANVNSQKYHTGGIAGYDADNFSHQLARNEVPTVLMRGEEVLTEQDPRHRNNLSLSRERSSTQSDGAVVNTVTVGDIYVTVSDSNASADQIASKVSDQLGIAVLKVLNNRAGQRAVYNAVGVEAKRNAGKIKGLF